MLQFNYKFYKGYTNGIVLYIYILSDDKNNRI